MYRYLKVLLLDINACLDVWTDCQVRFTLMPTILMQDKSTLVKPGINALRLRHCPASQDSLDLILTSPKFCESPVANNICEQLQLFVVNHGFLLLSKCQQFLPHRVGLEHLNPLGLAHLVHVLLGFTMGFGRRFSGETHVKPMWNPFFCVPQKQIKPEEIRKCSAQWSCLEIQQQISVLQFLSAAAVRSWGGPTWEASPNPQLKQVRPHRYAIDIFRLWVSEPSRWCPAWVATRWLWDLQTTILWYWG